MKNSLIKDNIKLRLIELMKIDWLFHLLFWICLYVIMILLDNSKNHRFVLVKEFVNVSFFAMVVYFNLNYIFPLYVKNKKLLLHLALLALLSILLTPIKTLVFYVTSSNYANVQSYFLKNQPSIFLSSYFIGLASSIYFIVDDWLQSQREKKELLSKNLQSELQLLKSQINPHFLFNSLNSLYALTLKNSEQAPNVVLQLSEMMRYMLYECNAPLVSLSKEIQYITNYLEIEKLRHKDKMKIDFDIKGNAAELQIAPLLLIPFIENGFKHGINNQIESGFINIKINIAINSIHLIVENSKAPVSPIKNEKKSGGIGLVNVNRRLEILYANHNLTIQDTNTYKIELSLILDN